MEIRYFDNENMIARDGSHPEFNRIFPEALYVERSKELSPFGNKVGYKTLKALNNWFDDYSNSFITFFVFDFCYETWGWGDAIAEWIQLKGVDEILNYSSQYDKMLDVACQLLIASAFGQFKIMGKVEDFHIEIVQRFIKQEIFIIKNIKIPSDSISSYDNEIEYLEKIYQDLNKIPVFSSIDEIED
jgi:uncharacterized protein YfeS